MKKLLKELGDLVVGTGIIMFLIFAFILIVVLPVKVAMTMIELILGV